MFRTSIITMLITMFSRVLGLCRGTLVAYFFGSSAITDAYYSAFKISNFFRQLLGEGALGNIFIPLYHKKVNSDGEDGAKDYIYSVVNLVGIFSIVVCILTIIFSNYIITIMVGGLDTETKLLASKLLRIMSVYFIFISLAGMIGTILNNFGKFIIPASTSIFFNIAIIVANIFFARVYGIQALAYGVVVGGLLQFLIVFIPLVYILKAYSFKIDFKDKYVKMIGIQLLPMLVGIFARQINNMVDQFFASFLESGCITILENATKISVLPVGVFGVTLSNIIFPSLSKATAKKDKKEIDKYIVTGLNCINFFVIPSLIVLTLYSKEVIKLLFSYGKFSDRDVVLTASALLFYSLGLVFYVGVHMMSKSFYAMGDNIRPAKFSMIAIVFNIVLNTILIKFMSFRGLALSTSLSSMLNFMLLFIYFVRKYQRINLDKIFKMSIQFLASSLLAYALSFYFNHTLIKFLVFSIVYFAIWALPAYKKRMQLFY